MWLFIIPFIFLSALLNAEEVENQQECTCEPECYCGDNVIPADSHSAYWKKDGELECSYAHACGHCGIWLPEEPMLFKPFIADPRQVDYSVGWRFRDRSLASNIIDVSFGDALGIYEWCDVWPWKGQLRIEIEGALWAVFAPLKESAPLYNADYYVGVPITYAIDRWQFRLRGFHISSHIGDEFLITHCDKGFERFNPSAEYLDFAVSHEFTDDIRLYGLLGVIMHHDESFRCGGPLYAEAGMELRFHPLQYIDFCNKLIGTPFYAMHWRYNRAFKHHIDMTYALGYEWAKFSGLCRKLRIFMLYHDGYGVDGQFCKIPTHYFSIRMSYGY
jgi:hypothetical protein